MFKGHPDLATRQAGHFDEHAAPSEVGVASPRGDMDDTKQVACDSAPAGSGI